MHRIITGIPEEKLETIQKRRRTKKWISGKEKKLRIHPLPENYSHLKR